MSIERIRGRNLQVLRNRLLRDNPLCVMCSSAGRVTAASEIDHIQAIVNGGRNEDSNYQALCRECHNKKTRIDLGQQDRTTFDSSGRVKW